MECQSCCDQGVFFVYQYLNEVFNSNEFFRVESIDGTAVVDEDYIKVDEVLTFEPGETEKEVKSQLQW